MPHSHHRHSGSRFSIISQHHISRIGLPPTSLGNVPPSRVPKWVLFLPLTALFYVYGGVDVEQIVQIMLLKLNFNWKRELRWRQVFIRRRRNAVHWMCQCGIFPQRIKCQCSDRQLHLHLDPLQSYKWGEATENLFEYNKYMHERVPCDWCSTLISGPI